MRRKKKSATKARRAKKTIVAAEPIVVEPVKVSAPIAEPVIAMKDLVPRIHGRRERLGGAVFLLRAVRATKTTADLAWVGRARTIEIPTYSGPADEARLLGHALGYLHA